jgi:hypothetical protein
VRAPSLWPHGPFLLGFDMSATILVFNFYTCLSFNLKIKEISSILIFSLLSSSGNSLGSFFSPLPNLLSSYNLFLPEPAPVPVKYHSSCYILMLGFQRGYDCKVYASPEDYHYPPGKLKGEMPLKLDLEGMTGFIRQK